MPYDVVERDGKYCVIKPETKEVLGCHETREQAIDQIQAIGARRHAAEAQVLAAVDVEPVDVDLDGYEPDEEELRALHRIVLEILRETGGTATKSLADLEEARGNIQTIISTFGRWAGGSHRQCVATLSGKEGISDPIRLCAWLKDRYLGTTTWRGKRSEAVSCDGPLTIRNDGPVLESDDAGAGWRWRVQIIQAGVSRNRTEYPLDVLHRAAPLYRGVPVFYSDGPDHDTRRRGFGAIAGWIVEARPNARGIEGILELNRGRPELRETFLHAWEVAQRTGRMPFGFSHVVPPGKYRLSVKKLSEGEFVRRIDAIEEVESVDIVMRPSAGGELLGLVAAVEANQSKGGGAMELLERLRRGERLAPHEIEALKASVAPEQYVAALEEAIRARPDDHAHEQSLLAEAIERVRQIECRAVLTEKLAEARAQGLPEPVVERIRRDFAGRVFDVQELEQRIRDDRELVARLAETVAVPRTGKVDLTVVEDQRERWQKAMDGLFEGRPVDGVRPFTSLKQAYRVITGTTLEYTDPNLARMILAEAAGWVPPGHPLAEAVNTTTFAAILGESMTRKLIREYNRPDLQTWRVIVGPNIVPLTDFRTQRRLRIGGYGELPVVAEGANYPTLTTPPTQEATYAPQKRGGIEELTFEAIQNDDIGALRRIPRELGRAAARTLYRAVWIETIVNNATCSYDSKPLFHADHANLGTNTLDAAGLLATENAMRAQTFFGTTEIMGEVNQPKILVVPPTLRDIAFKLTQSEVAVSATENATVPNIFREVGYRIVVVDYLTDANDWYAFADPENVPILEVGFLNGREEPELFVQDMGNVGSMFNADKVTYKIRHIWGIGILDHRGAYKNAVA